MGSVTDFKLRIASASGAVTDRRHGFADLAKNEDVKYIVGDWMSEYNMTTRGGSKINNSGASDEFEDSFLEALEPALPYLASRGIKVAVNAGASDTQKLYDIVVEKVKAAGLDLKVAWVGGDEVIDLVKSASKEGNDFKNLTTGKVLSDWEFEPIYAQCYLGCWGIVEAFKHGVDIVLCGRVADASPTIASAAYHFGWGREDYEQLAHAFVAGHFIECSTYTTGGNFSGFKSLPGASLNLGYPIAEIGANGQFDVTMQKECDGMVTIDTCKAQLLYEIQGPLYYNSDVVAVLDGIKIEQNGENRVHVSNVGYLRPPPTTKVGITAKGGYQAEAHYFLCGLDIEEKARMLERQVRASLDESKYHCLKFRVSGRCPVDPKNQDAATVDLRIFAQARNEADLATAKFLRPITNTVMQSYPGATFGVDSRQAIPKPYYEYWVALLSQSSVKHVCHIPSAKLEVPIAAPTSTQDFLYVQSTYETADPRKLSEFGPTTRVPLGYIVHARSGDKGSDCNVGLFVRQADEYEWLRSLLTVDKVRQFLNEDDTGKPIFRFELPNIWAVHFLLKDHLDRGVSSSSTYDVLGKNLAEYLRCKLVDVPDKFLIRGNI
ncbi:DUF1446-domain-containing protein [Eremomyces bilateralis CBS 781.70]|uniref:DUF1446-domain-containing protein n=1 Tax=Eremomyces bilateralis CBS 781.70 TaxID=1392243 RepID=A0A6G1GHW4_9PEZI|nr:DUF1446-domain-containing protein [Eremomyces bilateralis CBS 781.70]KAF1817469.1 DUF1446-domain-containing protein [Eremomyces bilateralis CBS 781.70]